MLMEVIRDCFTVSMFLVCYFSTLHPTTSGGDQHQQAWKHIAGRIACIAAFSAINILLTILQQKMAWKENQFVIGFSHAWQIICTAVQFVTSCTMFMLVLQFNDKESPAERIFQMENAFAIALLAFIRVLSPHLLSLPATEEDYFQRVFDICLNLIVAPISVGLLLLLPMPASEKSKGSHALDQSSLSAWGIFLLLAAVQLLGKPGQRTGGQHAAWNIFAKCCFLVLTMGLLQLRWKDLTLPSSSETAKETFQYVEDYIFFHSMTGSFIVRTFLVAWTGMSAARWYAELEQNLFLTSTESQRGKEDAEKAADMEDAQFALALAGIVLALYASMSSYKKQQQEQHGDRMMLTLLAVAAGILVICALQFIAFNARQMILTTSCSVTSHDLKKIH